MFRMLPVPSRLDISAEYAVMLESYYRNSTLPSPKRLGTVSSKPRMFPTTSTAHRQGSTADLDIVNGAL